MLGVSVKFTWKGLCRSAVWASECRYGADFQKTLCYDDSARVCSFTVAVTTLK